MRYDAARDEEDRSNIENPTLRRQGYAGQASNIEPGLNHQLVTDAVDGREMFGFGTVAA
jgi:hypothetical protein